MFEISKLKEKKLAELQEIAEELKISKYKTLKKLDLVYKILDHQASNPEEKEGEKTVAAKPKFNPRSRSNKKDQNDSNFSDNDDKKDVIKNLTVIKKIIEIENQRLNQMVIEIQETDTKNLILNLMRLSKVKGFLILCRMVMVF